MCSPPFFLTLLSYWNQWLQPKTNSPVLSADLPFQVRLSFIFPQKISSIQLHLGSLIRSFCSNEASRPAFVCLDVCSLCAPKSVVIIILRKFPSPFIVLSPPPMYMSCMMLSAFWGLARCWKCGSTITRNLSAGIVFVTLQRGSKTRFPSFCLPSSPFVFFCVSFLK